MTYLEKRIPFLKNNHFVLDSDPIYILFLKNISNGCLVTVATLHKCSNRNIRLIKIERASDHIACA